MQSSTRSAAGPWSTSRALSRPAQYLAGRDLVGSQLYQNGMDSGVRQFLNNVAGKPIRTWDARGHAFRIRYDLLQRQTHNYVTTNGAPEILIQRSVYGEGQPSLNLCGRLFRQYDTGGLGSNDEYDFKGNLTSSTRQLARDHQSPDWSPVADLTVTADLDAAAGPLLTPTGKFTTATTYDALNRPIQVVTPHSASMHPNVLRPGYNQAQQVATIDVWLQQMAAPSSVLATSSASLHAVTAIDYNARNQRTRSTFGNGTVTNYTYDPLTFRLTGLTTTRSGSFPANQQTVQDLSYYYDPVGNITHISDTADTQNVIFFRNQRVEPSADYTYDALYRLISATGREHLGQTGAALSLPQQVTNDDSFRVRLPQPGDGNAMGTYTEIYTYNPVGNILAMAHQVASGSWTRRYAYAEPSQITPGETGNRLSATSMPSDLANGPYSATYGHDQHGNMTRMPHLPDMAWDELDRLRSTTKQVVNQGIPGTTQYSYGEAARRIRKTTYAQAAPGQTALPQKERIYLGAVEIYREFATDGTTVTLERETLHVNLDQENATLIETRTIGTDPAPAQLQRYQYTNHLGSAILELDDKALIISYEEYFAYGSTSYQAVSSQTELPKRYRYTGKERDEENDIYYHGARYYIPWLARWASCDPCGLADGMNLNLYDYVSGNPIRRRDPTGRQQIANDLDPKNPANYTDFETFAQAYQDAMQTSVPGDQLLGVWASAHPAHSTGPASTASSQGNTAGSLATTAAFAPITAWQAITSAYQPIDAATGLPLEGPLLLYSGGPARAAATAVPPGEGYMIRNTMYYGPADAAEAALRARLGVGPNDFINPPGPYNAIWDPVSRMAVRDATLSGRGVTSMNNIFAVENLPPGVPTADPLGLSSSSIQARVELPALRGSGIGMGGLAAAGGVLTLYGATQEDQPVIAGIGYASGSLQVGGGVAYGTGALLANGELMAAGGLAVETGGVLAIPLLMWQDIKMQAEIQRAVQPAVNRMLDEGNYVGAALLSMPPTGFGY